MNSLVVTAGECIAEAGGRMRVSCAMPDGSRADAIAYTTFCASISPGDSLLINTSAVDLRLGTGGVHFVIANLSHPEVQTDGSGHIMKLRYTPFQTPVLSVEEPDSPWHDVMAEADSLDGMPVVCCELLSQVPAVVAGMSAADKPLEPCHSEPAKNPLTGGKAFQREYHDRQVGEGLYVRDSSQAQNDGFVRNRHHVAGCSIAVVMTDEAALPMAFSETLAALRTKPDVCGVITAGQAFGGDLEAVNLYSGLLAARHVLKADIAVVTPGPGTVGTGTKWGFSGVAQGQALNAAHVLGGRAVAVLRMSSGDGRGRHYGVSHHSITAVNRVCLAPVQVAVPGDAATQTPFSNGNVRLEAIDVPPEILEPSEEDGPMWRTMGRGPEEDPLYFESAAAAGILARRLWEEGK